MSWQQLRQQVLDAFNHRCQECGSSQNLEVHHVTPQKKGGTDHLWNLSVLCRKCHNIIEHDPMLERRNTIKITVNMPTALHKKMKMYAFETDTDMVVILDKAVREFLTRSKKQK